MPSTRRTAAGELLAAAQPHDLGPQDDSTDGTFDGAPAESGKPRIEQSDDAATADEEDEEDEDDEEEEEEDEEEEEEEDSHDEDYAAAVARGRRSTARTARAAPQKEGAAFRSAKPRTPWMAQLLMCTPTDCEVLVDALRDRSTEECYAALALLLLEAGGAAPLPDFSDLPGASAQDVVDALSPQTLGAPILCGLHATRVAMRLAPLKSSLAEICPLGLTPPPSTPRVALLQSYLPPVERSSPLLFIRSFSHLFRRVGELSSSLLAERIEPLLELAVLLADSESRNLRLAATAGALAIGDGLVANYLELREDCQRFEEQMELESSHERSAAVSALRAELDAHKGRMAEAEELIDAIRMTVANQRWRDKDPLVRWVTLQHVCQWSLELPDLLLRDSSKHKILGQALYDRFPAARRTVALFLATAAERQPVLAALNNGEGDFVSAMLPRLLELPEDADELTAAFGTLFLTALGDQRLKEEEIDQVVDGIWSCRSKLAGGSGSSSSSVLLAALSLFIDSTTFSASVFEDGDNEERAALHMRTIVEFLTEFGPRFWPLYDRFVSAFYDRCPCLRNVPLLLNLLFVAACDTAEKTPAMEEKYLTPIAALAVVIVQHLQANSQMEQGQGTADRPVFALSAEQARRWLQRAATAVLSHATQLLTIAKPDADAFICFTALIARAAAATSLGSSLEQASQLNRRQLAASLAETLRTCHHLGALDNLAAAVQLLGGADELVATGRETVAVLSNLEDPPDDLELQLRRLIAVLRTTDKPIEPLSELLPSLLDAIHVRLIEPRSPQLLALYVVVSQLAFSHEVLNLCEQESRGSKRPKSASRQRARELPELYQRWRKLLVAASRQHEHNSSLALLIVTAWLSLRRFLYFQYIDDDPAEDAEDRGDRGQAFELSDLLSTEQEIRAVTSIARTAVELIENSSALETGVSDFLDEVATPNPEGLGHSTVGLSPFGRLSFTEDLLDGKTPAVAPTGRRASRRNKQPPLQQPLELALAWRLAYTLVVELELQTWDTPLLQSPLSPILLSLVCFRSKRYEAGVHSLVRALCVAAPGLPLNIIGRALFAMVPVANRRGTARVIARSLGDAIPAGFLLSNLTLLQNFLESGLHLANLGDAGRAALRDCLACVLRKLPKNSAELFAVQERLESSKRVLPENRKLLGGLFKQQQQQQQGHGGRRP